MKNYIKFGTVTAHLVRQGETFPCPSKGHPPFLHERESPVVVLVRGDEVLRVVPFASLQTVDRAVFRGNMGRKPWELSPADVERLRTWASKLSHTKRKYQRFVTAPQAAPREVTPPKTWYFRRRAKVHPMAARELLESDYADDLPAKEKAWLDQFDRETALNRWADGEGMEPFFARGSEDRRKLQFEYNRRVDDIYAHKDWWPADIDGAGYTRDPQSRTRKLAEVLPASNPTEDDLIDAIDRSRE